MEELTQRYALEGVTFKLRGHSYKECKSCFKINYLFATGGLRKLNTGTRLKTRLNILRWLASGDVHGFETSG